MALMSSGLVLLCGCLIQAWLGQPWVIAEAALTLGWRLAHRGVLGAGSGAALHFNGCVVGRGVTQIWLHGLGAMSVFLLYFSSCRNLKQLL